MTGHDQSSLVTKNLKFGMTAALYTPPPFLVDSLWIPCIPSRFPVDSLWIPCIPSRFPVDLWNPCGILVQSFLSPGQAKRVFKTTF